VNGDDDDKEGDEDHDEEHGNNKTFASLKVIVTQLNRNDVAIPDLK
jgi:hypothetical protein